MFRFVLLLSVGLTITLILPLSAFGVNMAPPEIVTPRSAEPPSYPLAKILDQEAVSKMLPPVTEDAEGNIAIFPSNGVEVTTKISRAEAKNFEKGFAAGYGYALTGNGFDPEQLGKIIKLIQEKLKSLNDPTVPQKEGSREANIGLLLGIRKGLLLRDTAEATGILNIPKNTIKTVTPPV